MLNKKKLILMSILPLMLFSAKSFAATEADNQAYLCNDTQTTFHFKKTGAYQANTNNDHSADFELPPGNDSCVYIDYWLLHGYGGSDDNDDSLVFTDDNGAGQFTIKARTQSGDEMLSQRSYALQEMEGFKMNMTQEGYWHGGKEKTLEIRIQNNDSATE